MLTTHRKHYIPTADQAYQVSPITLVWNRLFRHHVLDKILPYVRQHLTNKDEPSKFSDVGCGSGYLTACFGQWLKLWDASTISILGRTGHVDGIGIFTYLVQLTGANMKMGDADLLHDIDMLALKNREWLAGLAGCCTL
jgi:Protein-L-isoaspartate(D-aspartate) O-methyltransferase (PCMT)